MCICEPKEGGSCVKEGRRRGVKNERESGFALPIDNPALHSSIPSFIYSFFPSFTCSPTLIQEQRDNIKDQRTGDQKVAQNSWNTKAHTGKQDHKVQMHPHGRQQPGVPSSSTYDNRYCYTNVKNNYYSTIDS